MSENKVLRKVLFGNKQGSTGKSHTIRGLITYNLNLLLLSWQGKTVFSPQCTQTGSGSQPASYSVSTVHTSPGRKAARGSIAKYSLASTAEIKNAWNYTSVPPHTFMAWCFWLIPKLACRMFVGRAFNCWLLLLSVRVEMARTHSSHVRSYTCVFKVGHDTAWKSSAESLWGSLSRFCELEN